MHPSIPFRLSHQLRNTEKLETVHHHFVLQNFNPQKTDLFGIFKGNLAWLSGTYSEANI
jgi:hypothetical protein